tara:strand:- start:2664 stop:3998 length:1335 start_codon:yes stop_codon:yes gene_type:complete
MRKFNTFIISLIIIIAFTEGAISLIGPSESFMRTFRELLIILLFISSFFQSPITNNQLVGSLKKYRKLGKYYIFSLFAVAIISMIYNTKDVVEFFLFFLRVLPPILFFWALIKINFNIAKVLRLLKILVIIQIPAVIIKFLIIGVSESGGIGTMSIHAGSLSTIFPLFVISYIFSLYLSRKNKKYIILIFLFLLFGLIGGKRALIVYTPVLLFFILFIYNKGFKLNFKRSLVKQVFGLFILGFVTFYFIARFNPNLNPEEEIGGSFDIEHIINISTKYNSFKGELGFSRTDAPEVLFNFLTKNKPVNFLLLGMGPGDIIQSSLLNNKYPGVENDRQLLMYKYGLGYGLRVGVLWTAIQIGILGALIYALFFYKITFTMFKILKKSNNTITKEYAMGLTGMGFVLLIDYLTYSPTFFYSGAISNSFFLLTAIVLKRFSDERRGLL